MLDKSGAHELSVHRKFFPAFAQAQFCFCSGNFALLLLRPENFVSTFRGERKGGGGVWLVATVLNTIYSKFCALIPFAAVIWSHKQSCWPPPTLRGVYYVVYENFTAAIVVKKLCMALEQRKIQVLAPSTTSGQ